MKIKIKLGLVKCISLNITIYSNNNDKRYRIANEYSSVRVFAHLLCTLVS